LRILEEWRVRCTPDDAQLVAEVLGSIAQRKWQTRWGSYRNESDPDITVIMPRDGLYVHVKLWAEENQFTIVSISDVPADSDGD